MKPWERFAITGMVCLALIISAALIAFAVALPRYQVGRSDGSITINDRFLGHVYDCHMTDSAYACLRLDPSGAVLLSSKDGKVSRD